MTRWIPKLSYAIFAAFLLCALTTTRSSASALSDATPAVTPAPSSDAKLCPAPATVSAESPGAPLPPIAHRIAGGEFDFIAWEGSTFTSIGSRFGESPKVLARDNGKQVSDRLHAGDTIHIDNRHIVPIEGADLIEVNLPQRMLFHFEGGRLSGAYPVAIGQPSKQWQTPVGSFTVIQMREDPTWRVPASIQREEEEAGKEVVDEIDPGPDNPLGKYWIGLSFPIIGIHGTNHPISVYSYRTHGCVRLHPDDIEALFNDVDLNDRGEIVYLPLMLARLDDGRIFLESEKDIYRKGTGGIDAVRALARANGIDSLIDWIRAGETINDQDGIARDVTALTERAGERHQIQLRRQKLREQSQSQSMRPADLSRRRFLRISAIAAAQLVVPVIAMARTTVQLRRRSLKFHALHTGESLTTTYWENGRYIPDELDRINYILRDFRANEVKPIDPALLDLLTRIQHRLSTNEPFQVISGYRSPVTNAMLHANSEGVAVHSLHLEGKAIDICVPGRSLAQLRGAALAQQSGGVGYYPKSNFVHVDTGRVRFW